MPRYRIFIDSNIQDGNPELFNSYCTGLVHQLVILPAEQLQDIIDQKNLSFGCLDANDLFIIRSKCNFLEKKLQGKGLPGFIGSCVSGCDHLDIPWLRQQGVKVYSAIGCNAQSVVEYVAAVIHILAKNSKLDLQNKSNMRATVIGCGHVGSLVVDLLVKLGFKVSVYDPFISIQAKHIVLDKYRLGMDVMWVDDLETIGDSDLISVHCSLTTAKQVGVKASENMLDKVFFKSVKPNSILINAARGGLLVADDFCNYAKHIVSCFDVWPNEPSISADIVSQTYLSTAHIAGHSVQGKAQGLSMVYNYLVKHYGFCLKVGEVSSSASISLELLASRILESSNKLQQDALRCLKFDKQSENIVGLGKVEVDKCMGSAFTNSRLEFKWY